MRRPSVRDLDPKLREAAVRIAERLAQGGHRAWIVGGTVRDLALGLEPHDLDMASAARPEQARPYFEKVHEVGIAFGTLVLHECGIEVQLTTFRSEQGYSDQRRPDQVHYGATAEEDARRRDFRCNAIFLDPRTDEVLDPEGGLADLQAKRLDCVGDPAARFREDGLRLMRLVRFAAAYQLQPTPAVLAAARREAPALAGVSPERVLQELSAMSRKPGLARAIELLVELGLLELVLPGFTSLAAPGRTPEQTLDSRLQALRALPEPVGLEALLSVLLDPFQDEETQPQAVAEALSRLERLRPSRQLREALRRNWRALTSIEDLLRSETPARASCVRLLREPHWPEWSRLARAWIRVEGSQAGLEALDVLDRERAATPMDQFSPQPFLASGDLSKCGLAPGPLWKELLVEAEDLQLDGRLSSRQAALSWLEARALELRDGTRAQLGGNKRRKPKARG